MENKAVWVVFFRKARSDSGLFQNRENSWKVNFCVLWVSGCLLTLANLLGRTQKCLFQSIVFVFRPSDIGLAAVASNNIVTINKVCVQICVCDFNDESICSDITSVVSFLVRGLRISDCNTGQKSAFVWTTLFCVCARIKTFSIRRRKSKWRLPTVCSRSSCRSSAKQLRWTSVSCTCTPIRYRAQFCKHSNFASVSKTMAVGKFFIFFENFQNFLSWDREISARKRRDDSGSSTQEPTHRRW